MPYFLRMATLTIRNLPDDVRDRLRIRAAANRRSMEAEARDTLAKAYEAEADLARPTAQERVERARAIVKPYLKPGVSLVDELLAERRAAAARGE
jgi:plasmid stability protein